MQIAPHMSIMEGIQYFGPMRRPSAVENGWRMTNVTLRRETELLISLGLRWASLTKVVVAT